MVESIIAAQISLSQVEVASWTLKEWMLSKVNQLVASVVWVQQMEVQDRQLQIKQLMGRTSLIQCTGKLILISFLSLEVTAEKKDRLLKVFNSKAV